MIYNILQLQQYIGIEDHATSQWDPPSNIFKLLVKQAQGVCGGEAMYKNTFLTQKSHTLKSEIQ